MTVYIGVFCFLLLAKAAYPNLVPDSAVLVIACICVLEAIYFVLLRIFLAVSHWWGEPADNRYSPNFIHWDYKSQRMIEDPIEDPEENQ